MQTQYLQENITNYQNFKKKIAQMKIHDVTGKRSELKRVGDAMDVAPPTSNFMSGICICHAKARKKHALAHKHSEEKLGG